jgi:dCMP deaminase
MTKMIIGISGTNGAGKTTTSDYLKKKGFSYYSCSDIIRDILDKNGQEKTRDNMRILGNKIREEYGTSELAKRLSEKIKANNDEYVIVDSLRHTDEINVFRSFPNFILLFLESPLEIRYERIRERKREDDFISFEKFKIDEKKEMGITGSNQQLGLCKKVADIIVLNEGIVENLYKQIDKIIEKNYTKVENKDNLNEAVNKNLKDNNDIESKKETINENNNEKKITEANFKRPSKDEYYMNIAKQIAARSNCLSAHHGALIVKDDQIVATGYNGAPRKTKDCLERGSCLRRELNIESGTRFELCRTVHAEQNAIINAARSGVSVFGGTMYLFSKKIFNAPEGGTLIDAAPCFICKKIILNAGLKEIVCLMSNGEIKKYSLDEWTKEWQENDMVDDVNKYSVSYKK